MVLCEVRKMLDERFCREWTEAESGLRGVEL